MCIRDRGDDNVAINDRYFKGGNIDFRGFDNAGVGPRILSFQTQNPGDEVVEFRNQALGGNAFAFANAEVSFPLGVASLDGSFFIEAGTVGLLDDADQSNVILGFAEGGPSDLFTVGSSCEGIMVAGVFCERIEDGLEPRVTAGASVFWESPFGPCLLYTSPSPRDLSTSRMPSSA